MRRAVIELTPEEIDALDRNRRQLASALAAIDRDPNNGAGGNRRRNLRSKAQLAAEAAERQLFDSAMQRAVQGGVSGEKRAFGYSAVPGGSLDSYRKAMAMAAEIDTPGKAMQLMIAADQGGDPQLAAQIARRARQMRGPADAGGHWQDVFSAWREAHPEHEGSLTDMDRAEPAPLSVQLSQSAYTISRPDDLRSPQVEQWAADADWVGDPAA